jgi:hypothetical protein
VSGKHSSSHPLSSIKAIQATTNKQCPHPLYSCSSQSHRNARPLPTSFHPSLAKSRSPSSTSPQNKAPTTSISCSAISSLKVTSANILSSAKTTRVPSTTKACPMSQSIPPMSPLPPPESVPSLPSRPEAQQQPYNLTLTTQKPSCRSPKGLSKPYNGEKGMTRLNSPKTLSRSNTWKDKQSSIWPTSSTRRHQKDTFEMTTAKLPTSSFPSKMATSGLHTGLNSSLMKTSWAYLRSTASTMPLMLRTLCRIQSRHQQQQQQHTCPYPPPMGFGPLYRTQHTICVTTRHLLHFFLVE